jgi:nucleotide-binding universal stress UspA family protein
MPNPIKFHSILHATDFSADSERAFAHALKAAVDERASLLIMHVSDGADESDHWESFPSVRAVLERWGFLEEGVGRRAVYEKLGVEVEKVAVEGDSISKAVVGYLEGHVVDLLVLATHARSGLPHWLSPSIAEPIARHAKIPVLFVPHRARGFVSTADGSVSLRTVLVPIDHEPNPTWGPVFADSILHAFGVADAEIALLHVGSPDNVPDVCLDDESPWIWKHVTRSGKPVDEIIAYANEFDVDLIVMVTEGHHGFWDALRGSTTEQVLRHAHCPILMVPNM